MKNTTQLRPSTKAYAAKARSFAEGHLADSSALASTFAQLDHSQQFGALVLTFDTLVNVVRTEGASSRSVSLLAAADRIALSFMSETPSISDDQRRVALRIENAVYAGVSGRAGLRGRTAYGSKDLLCALIAGSQGYSCGESLAVSRQVAAAATEDFTVFRSVGELVAAAAAN